LRSCSSLRSTIVGLPIPKFLTTSIFLFRNPYWNLVHMNPLFENILPQYRFNRRDCRETLKRIRDPTGDNRVDISGTKGVFQNVKKVDICMYIWTFHIHRQVLGKRNIFCVLCKMINFGAPIIHTYLSFLHMLHKCFIFLKRVHGHGMCGCRHDFSYFLTFTFYTFSKIVYMHLRAFSC
jgi:hypothetical protein